jgi:hypothetical protein
MVLVASTTSRGFVWRAASTTTMVITTSVSTPPSWHHASIISTPALMSKICQWLVKEFFVIKSIALSEVVCHLMKVIYVDQVSDYV